MVIGFVLSVMLRHWIWQLDFDIIQPLTLPRAGLSSRFRSSDLLMVDPIVGSKVFGGGRSMVVMVMKSKREVIPWLEQRSL
jgi:hypothetical protein